MFTKVDSLFQQQRKDLTTILNTRCNCDVRISFTKPIGLDKQHRILYKKPHHIIYLVSKYYILSTYSDREEHVPINI